VTGKRRAETMEANRARLITAARQAFAASGFAAAFWGVLGCDASPSATVLSLIVRSPARRFRHMPRRRSSCLRHHEESVVRAACLSGIHLDDAPAPRRGRRSVAP